MKPVYLDELNANSKAYKVKVKVIDKARARTSPNKGKIVYQSLSLEDDKGNKMRGVLFRDQVEEYKDSFVYNGEYEIFDAIIEPVEEKYRFSQTELSYQMSFGSKTVIQPMDIQAPPLFPDYRCVSQIPKAPDSDHKFDVLGVVLYVDEKPRTIVLEKREVLVREIVVIDHSTVQPLLISAWSDLAEAECDSLSFRADKFNIVGFTALRVNSYNGFSLATSMSTVFIHDVEGDKASALEEWVAHHQDALSDTQARVLDARNPSKERMIITLETLSQKKAIYASKIERGLQHFARRTPLVEGSCA